VSTEAPAPDGTAAKPEAPPAKDAKAKPKQRNPWPFVGLVIALCVAGWYLVNWMADSTRIQDCVMSGKKNCTPMDPSLGR
jgi:hypothetical protein